MWSRTGTSSNSCSTCNPILQQRRDTAVLPCPFSLWKNHRFGRFHRIPSSAEDGTKPNSVIFGDMRLGNDPSHAGQGDFCASNRALACMHLFCRKRPQAFFDKLKGHGSFAVSLLAFYGVKVETRGFHGTAGLPRTAPAPRPAAPRPAAAQEIPPRRRARRPGRPPRPPVSGCGGRGCRT